MGLADRDIPGIASSIAFETTGTPIAEERYMRCTGGTSYGIAATPRQMMLGRPGPKTPIRGLFLAGASTRTGHGLVGTLAGGAAAAAAVTGAPVAELLAPTRGGAAAVPAAWDGFSPVVADPESWPAVPAPRRAAGLPEGRPSVGGGRGPVRAYRLVAGFDVI